MYLRLLPFVLPLLGYGALSSAPSTSKWTGASQVGNSVLLPANWASTGGYVIPDGSGGNIEFGAAPRTTVELFALELLNIGSFVADDLTFTADAPDYTFQGISFLGLATPSLTLRGHVTTQGAGDLQVNDSIGVNLSSGEHEFRLAADSVVTVAALIDGTHGSITKTGAGTLHLANANTYAGGTTLVDGRLIATSAVGGLGTGAVTILGGELRLEDASLNNPITMTGGSLVVAGTARVTAPLSLTAGLVSGNGHLDRLTVGGQAIVSPGFNTNGSRIGTLTVDHFEAAGGGTYEWNLRDPHGLAGQDWDLIAVPSSQTLVVTATSNHKFTLKMISVTLAGELGVAAGFMPGQTYQWLIFRANSISRDPFNPDAFAFDTSAFLTDAGVGGTSWLSVDGSDVYLHFTAVPEPSTYVLMVLGSGFLAFTARRLRRRS